MTTASTARIGQTRDWELCDTYDELGLGPEELRRVLQGYPQALRDAYGGYYTLGRKFVGAIGHPWVMKFATRHGMPRPAVMRLVLKLLANLTEPQGGDAADRVINALSRLTPAA